ncbi:hypothetical protein ANN_25066 [Periplaneta americana]|uniref:Uncharacterized protein n=1 Tax=Periplaneta americana TaxID=6978 RepID=A0ABQ8S0G8_PERAM|nr:hypothetical protein ANN_25066 [Periplaneta americana]
MDFSFWEFVKDVDCASKPTTIEDFTSAIDTAVHDIDFNPKLSLYRRPPETTGSLDQSPWNVAKRRWMASAMSTRGRPTRRRSFASDTDRRTAGYTLLDRKRNEEILEQLEVESVEEKISRYKFNWLDHFETWTLTLREEQRLRVFENKVLRKIFGAKWAEITGEWTSECDEGDNAGEVRPGSNTESYPAFALMELRENPEKNLNQNDAESDQEEEKELVRLLAEKKLPTEGCTGRNGEREKNPGQKKI